MGEHDRARFNAAYTNGVVICGVLSVAPHLLFGEACIFIFPLAFGRQGGAREHQTFFAKTVMP